MYTDKEGNRVEVYDWVAADTLTDKDNIYYQNDVVELTYKDEDGDVVIVKGYSHVTGDNVTYFIPYDTEVGLWTA